MTLIVENGTGLATAESYISVADASARQAALGNTNWATLTNAEMEQALRRATVHMGLAYRQRWAGTRLLRTQALDWPRYGACVDGYDLPSDAVPADIADACSDLALKAASGDLAPDIARAIIREKVGPLETQYSEYGPQSTTYAAIDMLLAPFLRGGGLARLIRA